MASILVTWVGLTDLRAAKGEEQTLGPIAGAIDARSFDEVVLLSDHADADGNALVAWLQQRTKARIELRRAELRSPSHLEDIYLRATAVLDDLLRTRPDARLTFHTSPGTPAMAAVWILLAKSRYPAELLESSRQKGVQTMEAPFELSAELLSSRARAFDAGLDRITEGIGPANPAFRDIVHRSPVMTDLLRRAERAAALTAPVMILGESGTGKELLARAIHAASGRKGKLVPINCGGIPRDLVAPTLFGQEKGAFTGAVPKKGAFEEAHAGTLFLDEVGELTAEHQVHLLRALQEKAITPVGSNDEKRVDVRVIAATHRDLAADVREGRFREDLYFRLAVLVLQVPPLRTREGDVSLLAETLLPAVAKELGAGEKKLSPGARNLLLRHPWPGNVRELTGVLARAIAWSTGPTLTEADVREALAVAPRTPSDMVLGRPLGEGFSLPELLEEVARHYLGRAMDEARGNKTKAAELVGLPSYQTLTNWLAKYKMEG